MSHEALQREHDRLRALEASLRAEAARLATDAAALQTDNAALRAELDDARALMADLSRQPFGVKAGRLTPEQEAQVTALQQDLADASARPGPASDDVLEDERRVKRKTRRRPPRGGPVTIETSTITLEPEVATCPCCGGLLKRIGEKVTEETAFIPAKLNRRRTVRPKSVCRCGEAKVVTAPLPPRLNPQSTLGLALAVHILLTRYDDHLSFYRLEQHC